LDINGIVGSVVEFARGLLALMIVIAYLQTMLEAWGITSRRR
jgi:hypothetical protein